MHLKLREPSNNISFWIKLVVIFLTFGQRFVLTAGSFQIPMVMPVLYFSIFILFFKHKVKLDIAKLILFSISICLLALSIVLSDSAYPSFSYLYLIFIYFPLIFVFKDMNTYLPTLRYFQKIMIIITVVGIIQFSLPFFNIWYNDIFGFIPSNFVQSGYNTYYPIEYGSKILKSNGIFLLEPSFFSQFLAICIILELIYFKNYFRVLVYFIGILVTFSGTGIIILLSSLTIFLFKQKMKHKLVLLSILIILIIIVVNSPYGQIILNRLSEFNTNANSSANYRFLAPFLAIVNVGVVNKMVYFYGLGAGMADRVNIPFIPLGTNYSVIPKLIIEYGVLGSVGFLSFVSYSFIKYNKSKIILAGLFFMYLFLSGSLLQPQTIYFIFFLFCMSSKSLERT
jgi:hypothetical protein